MSVELGGYQRRRPPPSRRVVELVRWIAVGALIGSAFVALGVAGVYGLPWFAVALIGVAVLGAGARSDTEVQSGLPADRHRSWPHDGP